MNHIEKFNFRLTYQAARMRYFINGATKGHFGFRLFPQHFKKPVLSAEAGNQRLAQLIAEGKPFAAARFGGTEARTIADVLVRFYGNIPRSGRVDFAC